jgi:serine/threonine protein kinase
MALYHCPTLKTQVNTTSVLSDSSGEAVIYHTDHPHLIAKIYKPEIITPDKPHKLRVMVNNPPADPAASQGFCSIAWPKDLLLTPRGEFQGFLMPVIPRSKPLEVAIYPKIRREKFPKFDWEAMHIAALNVASIFGAVHDRQYVIGDVKPQNLMIDEKGRMAAVDTDSFQIRDPASGQTYPCLLVTQDYQPAEALAAANMNNPRRARTPSEDYFGLAVLIHYMLLGYHPFQGLWNFKTDPPETPDLIRSGYFPHAPSSKLKPGPKLVPIDALHPRIKALMFRCFIDGHHAPSSRPAAIEWRTTLLEAIREFDECPHGHLFFPTASPNCIWCDRKTRHTSEPFPACPDARKTRQRRLAMEIISIVSSGRDRDLVTAWRAHPELHKHPEISPRRAEIEQIDRNFQAFEAFARAYSPDPVDLDGLLNLWTAPLSASRLVRQEQINGQPALQAVSELKARKTALTDVQQAIASAGAGPFSIAAEQGIAAAWHRSDSALLVAGSPAKAAGTLASRVRLAVDRLTRWPQLEQAVKQREERAIVSAWGPPGLMDQLLPALAIKPRVEEARRRVFCLESFEAAASQDTCDEAVLWRIWNSEPGMNESVAGGQVSAKLGITPRSRVILARARLDALEAVASVIRQHGGAPQTTEGETAIVKMWDDHRHLAEPAAVGAGSILTARVEEARRRLDAGRRLTDAVARGADRAIAHAWGDSQLLSTYAPSLAHHARARLAARRMTAIAAIIKQYTADPADDAALSTLWTQCPDLHSAPIADEPDPALGRSTPRQVTEVALRRHTIFLRIQTALKTDPPRTADVAAAWDETLCRTHRSFRPLLSLIDHCIATQKQLGCLHAAIRGRVDSTSNAENHAEMNAAICAAWDEGLLGKLAEAQRFRPRVLQAFREHSLSAIKLRPAVLSPLIHRKNTLHLRWDWDHPQLKLCIIAARQGRFPTSPQDIQQIEHRQTVTRELYDAMGEAVLPFPIAEIKNAPHVSIWPVLLVFDEPLVGPVPLNLTLPFAEVPFMRYRLRNSGRRTMLELETDSQDLPELILLAAPGYPPQRDDPNAVEVPLELAGADPGETRLIQAELTRPARLHGQVMVRLYLRDPNQGNRLRISHPVKKDALLSNS